MYIPNKFSLAERAVCAVLAIGLFAYGCHGALKKEIALPGRLGIHVIQGESTILAFFGFVLWALSLLSVVIDHYDIRDNEAAYNTFYRWCGWCGVWLLFMAVVFQS